MTKAELSLKDKFDLSISNVILTGTQAIVRLALMQHALDRRAGLNTAGYITGYRGSPIAGLENQAARAKSHLDAANIHFQPGLNEDLAATALWGSQQAELRGEGLYDGVFGIWYGKGPGVDRSGDAFRHANHAGTSKYGGVLALMGDDHTCESSTSAHQSEFAFVDAMMPVLNPAGVQEILDFGLLGFALSRYAGVWVGLKCVKDNIEATATVESAIDHVEIKTPKDHELPEGGLNIRLGDTALAKEARLHDHKRDAILAFARANAMDKCIWSGGESPKIGIVTTGKSYLDTVQALEEIGIDEARAEQLGIRLFKVAMVWPLEPRGITKFAEGLDCILVIEEKRSLIETQIKEQLYGKPNAPVVLGKKDGNGRTLFQAHGALETASIAAKIGDILLKQFNDHDLEKAVSDLKLILNKPVEGGDSAIRVPYFCAGCPHNSSTILPDGARAYAGIGCHYMVQWMDRSTIGFTQMGGEGANWIGEAPFSKRKHVFQNIGDGTYGHSGYLAIRAAIASNTNITFKILYNDAVAMTGGQPLDGELSVPSMAKQMVAEGAKRVVIVTDEPQKYSPTASFPLGVTLHHRRELNAVQQELQEIDGVTVLIYDQTCAAEKRRRRKRGLYPDPAKRIFINTDVCEGCGDCSVQSNCVAIVPVETEFGRKRAIDQHACNKDYSCLEGFCPSFVTIYGGQLRKSALAEPSHKLLSEIKTLPDPKIPEFVKTYSILVTGVGGTGVLTISGLIGQAAQIEGKGFGSIDMSGLAQKGGAVHSHIRIARTPSDIKAIRASRAGVNLILGCDLVTASSTPVLSVARKGVTHVAVNDHETITTDFTHNPDYQLPADALRQAIKANAGTTNVSFIDARKYALKLSGDSIATNMFLFGYAYQLGLIPVGSQAIEQAIELNNVAVAMNKRAFNFGRLAAHNTEYLDEISGLAPTPAVHSTRSLHDIISIRRRFLTAYQDANYARKYANKIEAIAKIEKAHVPGQTKLAEMAAKNYFKLLAYKDEYEVARLFADAKFRQDLEAQFEGDYRLEYNLAPPLFSRKDPHTGLPMKRRFGPWMLYAFRLLRRLKFLRGTFFDPFGYSQDRKLERKLIANYEASLDYISCKLSPETYSLALELVAIPETIRGFGHVKQKSAEHAIERQNQLLKSWRSPEPETPSKKAA